ncbi:MAG: HAMP domain-containing sensor histidine kinase [Pelobium sp.]
MTKFKLNIAKDSFPKGISNFWHWLIGAPALFNLESRIFHSLSICLIVLSTFYAPYNFYAGLYVAAASAIFFAVFYFYQYYHSRFLGKKYSTIAFGLIGIVIFGSNYFFTSGIDGSTDLIWPVHLLIIFAISPYKQHLKWLALYLLFFIAIHWVEFQFPYLITHPFSAGKGQFIDRITAFPIPVMVIYFIITFIRQSYDREKKSTEEKTLAVAASNEHILLQKEQLEHSNIEKNKLMSIISHDLRTPLINIQNYLELLHEYDLESTERNRLEKALLSSTTHTLGMLSNLLSWSKSQMEGPNVQLAQVNLLQVLSATLEMEKLNASKKEITLNYQIPAALNVIADVDMLQLVVRNLISNAVKFTPKGGEIKVSALAVLENCKISIIDNGKGIPEDKKENIFSIKSDPEFGTNNERGVGLGLVLCKEFVERQGGSIGFKSKLGEGAEFFVFIPSTA